MPSLVALAAGIDVLRVSEISPKWQNRRTHSRPQGMHEINKGGRGVVYVAFDHVGLTSLLLLYNQRTPYAYETKRRYSFNAETKTSF
jgi:hypothetical protein